MLTFLRASFVGRRRGQLTSVREAFMRYRSASRWLISSLVWLLACESDSPTTPPAASPQQLRGTAIAIDIDLVAGSALVRSPVVESDRPIEPSFAMIGQGPNAPRFALLARNEVSASTSNLTRSRVGEFTPQRVRVRFDLSLTNRLLNSDLVPSTFPVPP